MVSIDSYSVNSCNCGVPVGGGEIGVFFLHHHEEPFQNLYLTGKYAMENLSYLQINLISSKRMNCVNLTEKANLHM